MGIDSADIKQDRRSRGLVEDGALLSIIPMAMLALQLIISAGVVRPSVELSAGNVRGMGAIDTNYRAPAVVSVAK